MSQPAKPRLIVITGAAAGVGRAAAQMFARTEGAHIVLPARRMEALGGKAIICQGDVADAEAVEAAAARVEAEFGPTDKLPHQSQPVPPICQLEAAEAIVFASKNTRLEIYVGPPMVVAIVGNKLFPRLGDWYLGKPGVKGRQTQEKADPNAPNNLCEPVGGDPGAHGRFDDRAFKHSAQLCP